MSQEQKEIPSKQFKTGATRHQKVPSCESSKKENILLSAMVSLDDQQKKSMSITDTFSDNNRRTRSMTNGTCTTNPGRAVQSWQSHLDKEIQLQQLLSQKQMAVANQGGNVAILNERIQTNSNEGASYTNNKMQQSKVQTIMTVEKQSKQQKLPLQEILQLEQQSSGLIQQNSHQHRNISGCLSQGKKGTQSSGFTVAQQQHRITHSNPPKPSCQKQQVVQNSELLSQRQKASKFMKDDVNNRNTSGIVKVESPINSYTVATNIQSDRLVFREATKACLNTSQTATAMGQFEQPRQATQIRLGNLINQQQVTSKNDAAHPACKENNYGGIGGDIQNLEFKTNATWQATASVLNQQALSSSNNQQKQPSINNLANCSSMSQQQTQMMQNRSPGNAIVTALTSYMQQAVAASGTATAVASSQGLKNKTTATSNHNQLLQNEMKNSARHHRSLGRMNVTTNSSIHPETPNAIIFATNHLNQHQVSMLAKQKSSGSVLSASAAHNSNSHPPKQNGSNNFWGILTQNQPYLMLHQQQLVNGDVTSFHQQQQSQSHLQQQNRRNLVSPLSTNQPAPQQSNNCAANKKYDAVLKTYFSQAMTTPHSQQSSSTTAIHQTKQGGVLHTGRTPIKHGSSAAGTMLDDVLNNQGGAVGPSSNLKFHRVVISQDSRAHAPNMGNQVQSSQTLNSIDLPLKSKSVISHSSNTPAVMIRLDQSKGRGNSNRAVGATTVNASPRTPQIKMKVFDGQRITADFSNGGFNEKSASCAQGFSTQVVAAKIAAMSPGISSAQSNKAGAFQHHNANYPTTSLPQSLKKMNSANQSLDRYLQQRSTQTTGTVLAAQKSENASMVMLKNTAATRNNLSSAKNQQQQQRQNLHNQQHQRQQMSETNGSYGNNFRTLNSEEDDGGASASANTLGGGLQFQSLESMGMMAQDEAVAQMAKSGGHQAQQSIFTTQGTNANQAIFRSLEVLEECSNEGNSPGIKQKKATRDGAAILRRVSSSPTNFINCSTKKRRNHPNDSECYSSDRESRLLTYTQVVRSQKKQKTESSLPDSQQITLSNQKNKLIRMRDISITKESPKQQHCMSSGVGTSFSPLRLVDTSQFYELTKSVLEQVCHVTT